MLVQSAMRGICATFAVVSLLLLARNTNVVGWHSPQMAQMSASVRGETDCVTNTMEIKDIPRVYIYNSSALLEARGGWPHFAITNGVYKDTLASMYSGEFFLLEWIRASRYVVTDPSTANLFLIPQYGAYMTEFARQETKLGLFACSANVTKHYLDLLVDGVKATEWYRRRKGADHMWIFPWDHGCDLFPRLCSKIENFIHIVQEPTDLQRPLTKRPLIVPAPVQSTWSWEMTQQLTFLRACQAAQLTGPFCKVLRRPKLILFAGTIHKDRGYSRGVRQDLKELFSSRAFQDVTFIEGRVPDYETLVASASFCLCPPGWAPWSPRLYAAVAGNCVPVMFPQKNYFMALPFGRVVDWDSFLIQIPEGQVNKTYEILFGISDAQLLQMRLAMAKYVSMLLMAQYPDQTVDLVLAEALEWSQKSV